MEKNTKLASLEIEGLETLTTEEAKKTNGGISRYGYFCAGLGTIVACASRNQQWGVNVAKVFYGDWNF